MKNILNKNKKYLVCWKRFIVEHDIQKKKENLRNAKEVVVDFEERISVEVRSQKKLEIIKE